MMVSWVDSSLCKNKLREKYLNTEIFLVCIFSPNKGKYGPEKTPYLDTFHAVQFFYKNPSFNFCKKLRACYEKWSEKSEARKWLDGF